VAGLEAARRTFKNKISNTIFYLGHKNSLFKERIISMKEKIFRQSACTPAIAGTLTLMAVGVCGAAQSFAQDSGASRLTLEEVIVTAQRRQESLQEVPISVSAFSNEELKRLSVSEAQDIQFSTPGLTFPQDNGTVSPYIRGKGANFTSIGLEGPVAVYLDDVYLQTQFGLTGLVDVEQIQVLKGPQGTLYGRNATGGALLINTANPTRDFEGHVSAGAGNYGQQTYEAVLNVPVSDTFALRFAAGLDDYDGYVENVIDGEDHGGLHRTQSRVKALWEPTSELSVVFKGEYVESQRGYLRSLILDGTGAPTGLDFDETMQSPENPENLGGENKEKVWSTGLTVNYDADDWSISNTLGYRNTRLTSGSDLDYLYPNILTFSPNFPDGISPLVPGGVEASYEKNVYDEVKWTSNFEGDWNYLLGASYMDSEGYFPAVLWGGAFGDFIPFYQNWVDTKSTAIFGEVYYEFSDNWKLTLGGRYNKDEKDLEVFTNDNGMIIFGLPPALQTFEQDDTWESFTPRAVISYDAGKGNYYFSYNEGFKAGGFNTPVFLPQTPLDPEEVKGYELGAKFDLLDGQGRLNVALFYSESSDVQVTSIKQGVVVQENAAEVKAQGLEADFQVLIGENLTLNLGGSYLDSEYDSFPAASVFSIQGGVLADDVEDLSGERTQISPEFTANMAVTYSLELVSEWSADFTLSGYYSDEFDFNAGAGGPLRADRQDSYTLFNLTGQLATPGEDLTISFWVNNLTDEEYYDRIQTSATWGVYGVPALPRMYGGSVQYNF
jgi:iron complex outermembrane recepter protein